METKTKIIIAVFRGVFGALLIAQALPLMDRGFLETLPGQLNTYCANNPFPALQWAVSAILIPQVDFVGAAFVIGLFLIGLSFTLGFLSRTFGLFAAAYVLLFALLTQHMGWVYQQNAVLLELCFLAIAAIDAGQFYGLDGYLFHRPQQSNQIKKKPQKPKQLKNLKPMKAQVARYPKSKMPPLLEDGFDDDD